MEIYLVGGAVRDQLLGRPIKERDWIVVGSTPEEMVKRGFRPVGRDFPVFLHPETKEEYALARTERKSGKGYKGFICYAAPDVTLEEDLKRRDLTINAMAQAPDGRIIDPYHGQEDLMRKVLRHVSSAFVEDPLRVLRVARFGARYQDFSVHPDTMQLMREMVQTGELAELVPERVWVEMTKALCEPSPQRFFTILNDCGALPAIFPELVWNENTSKHLKKITSLSTHSTLRFAVMMFASPYEAITAFCDRLRVPLVYYDLARLLKQNYCALDTCVFSPEEVLGLFEKMDAFRRPERFKDFLICCEAIDNSNDLFEKLQKIMDAFQSALTVRFIKNEQSVLTGKEIAQWMHDARCAAIKAALTRMKK